MEEEAERCAPLLASYALLGVQAAARHYASEPPLPPRQGSSHGLQGQAGLRRVPRARAPWRPQEARQGGGCAFRVGASFSGLMRSRDLLGNWEEWKEGTSKSTHTVQLLTHL